MSFSEEISATQSVSIQRVSADGSRISRSDLLSVEEPLETTLVWQSNGQWNQRTLSVTMRTPGHDAEWVQGFLFTEGVIQHASEIQHIRVNPYTNKVFVEVSPEVAQRSENAQRNFYTTSSCGVCGKSSLEAVAQASPYAIPENFPKISEKLLFSLPEKLRSAQETFEQTGGLHASALFDTEGNLQVIREDVGRHNALDKVIGTLIQNQLTPASSSILVLSGRISFELVQKAAMAGIPIIAALGAPSSLAVELAEKQQITLVGFLHTTHANVYTHSQRILL